MSPALNGSTMLQRFEHSNAVEICNGIMFDFYPGLSHMIKEGKRKSVSLASDHVRFDHSDA